MSGARTCVIGAAFWLLLASAHGAAAQGVQAGSIHIVIEYSDEKRALPFERDLESGSDRAFAKRHF